MEPQFPAGNAGDEAGGYSNRGVAAPVRQRYYLRHNASADGVWSALGEINISVRMLDVNLLGGVTER
jgi:hypothetical protein